MIHIITHYQLKSIQLHYTIIQTDTTNRTVRFERLVLPQPTAMPTIAYCLSFSRFKNKPSIGWKGMALAEICAVFSSGKYIYIYVCVCVCVCVYIYIYIFIYIYIYSSSVEAAEGSVPC